MPARRAFQRMDADGDGLMTREEPAPQRGLTSLSLSIYITLSLYIYIYNIEIICAYFAGTGLSIAAHDLRCSDNRPKAGAVLQSQLRVQDKRVRRESEWRQSDR
jgi:hypothetical protein